MRSLHHMQLSAQQLYSKLLNSDIKDHKGLITAMFMDVSAQITSKSAVGYVFQDWLEVWMRKEEIEFRKNHNSQTFPDFYLNKSVNTLDMIEVKTFDGS